MAESDATLILTAGMPSGGTAKTIRIAVALAKPHLVVDLDDRPDAPTVRRWLAAGRPGTLNVAGPRESTVPGIYRRAAAFLGAVLA